MMTLAELSPAKKAWLTRRAMAAARVTIEAKKAAVPVNHRAPVAISEDNPLCEMFVDDDRVGSGRRLFVVIATTDKSVTLLSPSSLQSIVVARASFERKATSVPTNRARPSRVRAIILRNVKLADRVNDGKQKEIIPIAGAEVERALQVLA